jgi:hypothetical protein
MRNDLTELVLVVDRSGSMSNGLNDIIAGAQKFLDDQKKEIGHTNVTLVQFDTVAEVVYVGKCIKEIPTFTLVPRNYTALYDGMGMAIKLTGERLAKMEEKDRPALVIVLTITDGGENSSVEYKLPQIAEMVKHQREVYNWQFSFIGANQDSFLVAKDLNLNTNQVANYSQENSSEVFTSAGNLVKSLRSLAFNGNNKEYNSCGYSDADRNALVSKV